MSAATTAVTAADRLGFTLFAAAALHGLVILGVGFGPLAPGEEAPQALDVVMVQTETDDAPDEADFLASVASAGGGESEQADRPRAPVSSPEPEAHAGIAPVPLEAGAPDAHQPTPDPLLTADRGEILMPAEEQPRESDPQELPHRPDPVEFDAQLAALAAEIDNALMDYAQRPRKHFVTARTRESPAAAYMHEWVRTVERIGNLNYPDAARRNGLSGALILVVAIRADGSLHDVRIRASSGQSVLDTAAEEIVRRAAPFDPFPDSLRDETDILYITRTWEFSSGNRLETR